MTWELLAGIGGLAALDAFNPATIAGVTLILLAPVRRPVASALAFVLGAYTVVLLAGVAVFTGAGAAATSLTGGFTWVRRIALGLAAALLLVAAARRLRDRWRPAVRLPRWFGPWTAAPLGVLLTGADLPNAFPYLVAIERLLAAGVAREPALLVLAGYGLVYCLPCLVLLVLGVVRGAGVRARLRTVFERFGTERVVRRSLPVALLLGGAALLVGVLAAI